jgi:glycerophosphoryl diester phosphodiesterase
VTVPDLQAVDELCRLVVAARRLGCDVHLTGVDPDLRSLLDVAGVAGLMCDCPAGRRARNPAEFAADLR